MEGSGGLKEFSFWFNYSFNNFLKSYLKKNFIIKLGQLYYLEISDFIPLKNYIN